MLLFVFFSFICLFCFFEQVNKVYTDAEQHTNSRRWRLVGMKSGELRVGVDVTAVAHAFWWQENTGNARRERERDMSCCVVGCQNRNAKIGKLHFYRIPSLKTPFEANRRRLWLQAINRTDWTDETIRNSRLCSAHFISGIIFYTVDHTWSCNQ